MAMSLKPVEDLTESERFSIAFAAGVPIKEFVFTENSIKVILQPALISIIDGKYVVAYKPKYR